MNLIVDVGFQLPSTLVWMWMFVWVFFSIDFSGFKFGDEYDEG